MSRRGPASVLSASLRGPPRVGGKGREERGDTCHSSLSHSHPIAPCCRLACSAHKALWGPGSSRRPPCPSIWVGGASQDRGTGLASQQLCPDQVETRLFCLRKFQKLRAPRGALQISSKCEGTEVGAGQRGDGGRTLRCLWGRDRDWLLGSWAFLFPFLGKPFFPRNPLLLQLLG